MRQKAAHGRQMILTGCYQQRRVLVFVATLYLGFPGEKTNKQRARQSAVLAFRQGSKVAEETRQLMGYGAGVREPAEEQGSPSFPSLVPLVLPPRPSASAPTLTHSPSLELIIQ